MMIIIIIKKKEGGSSAVAAPALALIVAVYIISFERFSSAHRTLSSVKNVRSRRRRRRCRHPLTCKVTNGRLGNCNRKSFGSSAKPTSSSRILNEI